MDPSGCLFWFVVLMILAVTLLGLVLTYSSHVAREKKERLRQFGERLAGKLEGRFEHLRESGGVDVLVVRFKRHGRDAELEIHSSEGESSHALVRTDLRGIAGGALRIGLDDVPGFYKRLFRIQDIVIGNQAFDQDFIVQANPEEFAHRIFEPERRSRAVGIVRRVARLGPPMITLTADELSVKVRALFDDVGPILSLVEAASDWLELLIEIGPSAGIFWVSSGATSEGQCRVCGTPLAGEVVRCTKCQTPHHEDCWQYTGHCSTYACGERRAVRA